MTKLNERERMLCHEVQASADGGRLTVAEMAERAGTSPASLVRLAQKLGYHGWSDMYADFCLQRSDLARTDDPTAEKIGELCDVIERHAGDAMLIDGIGDGEYPCDFLRDRLDALGLDALNYRAETAESLARLGRNGLVIIFNESGVALYNRVAEARRFGLESFAVTGRSSSPIALTADHAIVLRCNKTQVRSYEPDFFCARCLVLVELVTSELVRRRVPA